MFLSRERLQVEHRGVFRNGKREGPWIHYHYNGRLSSQGTYKDGKKDGPWVEIQDNGQWTPMWEKGNYKDGKKDGTWILYSKRFVD